MTLTRASPIRATREGDCAGAATPWYHTYALLSRGAALRRALPKNPLLRRPTLQESQSQRKVNTVLSIQQT